jgi:hypothetical protein
VSFEKIICRTTASGYQELSRIDRLPTQKSSWCLWAKFNREATKNAKVYQYREEILREQINSSRPSRLRGKKTNRTR